MNIQLLVIEVVVTKKDTKSGFDWDWARLCQMRQRNFTSKNPSKIILGRFCVFLQEIKRFDNSVWYQSHSLRPELSSCLVWKNTNKKASWYMFYRILVFHLLGKTERIMKARYSQIQRCIQRKYGQAYLQQPSVKIFMSFSYI